MTSLLLILLFSSSVFGLIMALKARDMVSTLIALGFVISVILIYLSPQGLFYHSVAIAVISSLALSVLILISKERFSSRHRSLAMVVTVPYILVCSFKLLHLQGVHALTLGLYLTLAAFVFFTLDRRIWDNYWAHLLFIFLAALSIIMQ